MGVDAGALVGGRYRVQGTLGRGGVAEVLGVLDVARGLPLALKRLHADAPAPVRALFELEYRTLASLRHPHIVEAHEFGRDLDGCYYTMELLHGADLAQRVPLPWREACALIRDAAQGLGVLHARGLVHRDISPRNLWRTPDGRVKLIDFGTLSPFGPPANVVGTPPCVPPEALRREPLDARSDLYALGAVTYYLLTGLHAFPARDLAQLPELWEHEPARPSAAVQQLQRADLGAIPSELDALVGALLDRSPLARPASTAELIDRLDGLLGDAGTSSLGLAEVQLAHPAFVGRARELTRLRRLYALARRGRGQSLVLEGEPGQGRTRLLRELAIEWSMDGTTVVVRVDAEPGPFGTASALALQLLEVQPTVARAALRPFASALAQVPGKLRERLGPTLAGPAQGGSLRSRAQVALRDWLLALSARNTLVVLIDGIEHADEESLAFLVSLALSLRERRILLVSSLVRERTRERGALEQALLRASRSLVLAPLDEGSSLSMLGSLFGTPERVPRLARRLHERARGNPGQVLELCRGLLRRDTIGFASGAWTVPHELSERQLQTSHQPARAPLERIDAEARAVARSLSVHAGAMGPVLEASWIHSGRARESALSRLLADGVLGRDDRGLHFTSEEQRQRLLAELDETARRVLQHQLAEVVLRAPEASTGLRLQAGVQLLHAGDPRALSVLQAAAAELCAGDEDPHGEALVQLELALEGLRARKVPESELSFLLAALALAAEVEPALGARHGDAALRALWSRLSFAPRLHVRASLWLGALARRARARREVTLELFLRCACRLASAAARTIDPARAARCAEALVPLRALGEHHEARLAEQFCRLCQATARDATAEVERGFLALSARLEAAPMDGPLGALRARCLSFSLLVLGSVEARRGDPAALRRAQQLEEMGAPHALLAAAQTRARHFGLRGERAPYERELARAEQLALQQGAGKSYEVWEALGGSLICSLTRDALGLKRNAERLSRLADELPSLGLFHRFVRADYLALHGRLREAVALLEGMPAVSVAARAQRARILNRLGEFAAARALCEGAPPRVAERDDVASLALRAAHAVARAGLGELGTAEAVIAELAPAPDAGPLRHAAASETGAQLAILTGELALAERQLAALERWALESGMPSLVQYARAFAARAHAPDARLATLTEGGGTRAEATWSLLERTLGGGLPVQVRAERALRMVAERAQIARGSLLLLDTQGRLVTHAQLGAEPEPEVAAWLCERLEHEREDDATELVLDEQQVEASLPDVLQHGAELVRMLPLIAPSDGGNGVIGALLLFSRERVPVCPPDLLSAIAVHFARELASERALA